MRYLVDMFKDDPVEVIGGVIAWAGLGFLIFMLSVIGA